MRVQRTRSPRIRSVRSLRSLCSPLTRYPLGGVRSRGASRFRCSVVAKFPSLTFVVLRVLLSAVISAAQEATPSPIPSNPAPSRTPSPGRQGKCLSLVPPVLVHRVEPDYPADIRKQGVTGAVLLEGIVDVTGRVVDIRALQSPRKDLTWLAIEAVKKWQYKPALCDGRPVRAYMTFTISFSLGK